MRDDEFDGPRRPPPPPDTSSGSAVKAILIVLGSIAVIGFCLIAGVVGLVVYGVNQARRAITQSFAQFDSQARCTEVATALSHYQAKNGHFPPPSLPTKSGKPGLSWRVAILPEMGQDALYRQFKIDEPWDHPDNMRLADQCPRAFLPPNTEFGRNTHLRVFVGPGSMFEFGKTARLSGGNRKDTILITDGLSNTIAFVEAATPVLWIQPDELPFTPGGKVPPLGQPGNDMFYAGMADGWVRQVAKNIDAKKLEAAITAAGGEKTDLGP